MKPASSAGSAGPGGYTSTQPPAARGANSSRVDASKASGASRSIRSPGPACTQACGPGRTSLATARCGTRTALGIPVDPDVNATYATRSPLGVTGLNTGDPAAVRRDGLAA